MGDEDEHLVALARSSPVAWSQARDVILAGDHLDLALLIAAEAAPWRPVEAHRW